MLSTVTKKRRNKIKYRVGYYPCINYDRLKLIFSFFFEKMPVSIELIYNFIMNEIKVIK